MNKIKVYYLSKLILTKKIGLLAWESPTITSWGSIGSKMLSTILVLPLLLRKLPTTDIALWYVFTTITIIQVFADFGFNDTFVRFISYGYSGISREDFGEDAYLNKEKLFTHVKGPNWILINTVWNTITFIYNKLVVLVLILYLVVGSMIVNKTILQSSNVYIGWISWIIFIIGNSVGFFGNRYGFFLNGLNKVALNSRWNTFFSFLLILTNFIVLLLGGNLFGLVIGNSVWIVLSVILKYLLCRKIENGVFLTFKKEKKIDRDIFNLIWPSAWRSAVGVFMSNIVINASGLIVAQIENVNVVASYLLGYRFIQIVVTFSLSPFYSKIPTLNRLRAEGNIVALKKLAQRGMMISFYTYLILFIGIGITASFFLDYIKSNAHFVSPLLWSLFGLGFFIERYGAMHIQLYSTTNHIIWHIANTITGVIYLFLSFFLIKYINIYAFPVAIIISYLAFYSWYSPYKSYKSVKSNFFQFEKRVFIPALLIMIIFIPLYLMIFNLFKR